MWGGFSVFTMSAANPKDCFLFVIYLLNIIKSRTSQKVKDDRPDIALWWSHMCIAATQFSYILTREVYI